MFNPTKSVGTKLPASKVPGLLAVLLIPETKPVPTRLELQNLAAACKVLFKPPVKLVTVRMSISVVIAVFPSPPS